MEKDYDFFEELRKMAQPREKTSLEKALELAQQIKDKVNTMTPTK